MAFYTGQSMNNLPQRQQTLVSALPYCIAALPNVTNTAKAVNIDSATIAFPCSLLDLLQPPYTPSLGHFSNQLGAPLYFHTYLTPPLMLLPFMPGAGELVSVENG